MNKDNLRILVDTISTMPVDRHYFQLYQSVDKKLPQTYCKNLEEFNASTNCASVFGYFALTPTWQAIGKVSPTGEPILHGFAGLQAIRVYLDTTFNTCRKMVCGDLLYKEVLTEQKTYVSHHYYSEFYEKDSQLLTVGDVVNRLSKFLPCVS